MQLTVVHQESEMYRLRFTAFVSQKTLKGKLHSTCVLYIALYCMEVKLHQPNRKLRIERNDDRKVRCMLNVKGYLS